MCRSSPASVLPVRLSSLRRVNRSAPLSPTGMRRGVVLHAVPALLDADDVSALAAEAAEVRYTRASRSRTKPSPASARLRPHSLEPAARWLSRRQLAAAATRRRWVTRRQARSGVGRASSVRPNAPTCSRRPIRPLTEPIPGSVSCPLAGACPTSTTSASGLPVRAPRGPRRTRSTTRWSGTPARRGRRSVPAARAGLAPALRVERAARPLPAGRRGRAPSGPTAPCGPRAPPPAREAPVPRPTRRRGRAARPCATRPLPRRSCPSSRGAARRRGR